MSSIAESQAIASDQTDALPLPEELNRNGSVLFATDAISAAVAITVSGVALHAAISAFISLALTMTVATATGRYRASFAVLERDEWYAVVGIMIPGATVGAIACVVLGLPWIGAIIASVLWALIAGACAARLHGLRRAGITYAGRLVRTRTVPLKARDHVERAVIRFLDVVFASVGLVLLSPVLLVVILATVVDDGIPPLFSQRRVGCDDREFMMYKVRTMRRDAGSTWVEKARDERITRVGSILRRTSLDELPQLFNVLRGEMSLVGPRPEMHEYVAKFNRQVPNYWQRHRVRPGISGWAQLYLPRTLTPNDAPVVLQYDLFYVEFVGVYLYLQCLVKTAAEIVLHKSL